MVQRPMYIRLLLQLNYAPLLTDNDMVWLADPLPFVSRSLPFDLILQADNAVWGADADAWPDATSTLQEHLGPNQCKMFGFQACACFLRFLPTPASLLIVNRWIDSMSSTGFVDEGDETVRTMQGHFNTVLQRIMSNETEREEVRIGLVPPQRFPAGIMAFEHERFILDRSKLGFVHVNFALGTAKKVLRLKSAGLWSVSEEAEALMAATRAGGANATATASALRSAASASTLARRMGIFWGEAARKEVKGPVNAAGEQLDMTRFVQAAQKHSEGGVLVLTTVDADEVDLFLNWQASVDQAGITNYVVLTGDKRAALLLKNSTGSHLVLQPFPPSIYVPPKLSTFSTRANWRLPFLLRQLLELNITCMYSSPATVWFSSPLRYLSPDFDLILQSEPFFQPDDGPQIGATSVAAAQIYQVVGKASSSVIILPPSAISRELVDNWAARVSSQPLGSPSSLIVRRQLNNALSVVWQLIESRGESPRVGLLPRKYFPHGTELWTEPWEDRKVFLDAVILSDNHHVSNEAKESALKAARFWLRHDEAVQ